MIYVYPVFSMLVFGNLTLVCGTCGCDCDDFELHVHGNKLEGEPFSLETSWMGFLEPFSCVSLLVL